MTNTIELKKASSIKEEWLLAMMNEKVCPLLERQNGGKILSLTKEDDENDLSHWEKNCILFFKEEIDTMIHKNPVKTSDDLSAKSRFIR